LGVREEALLHLKHVVLFGLCDTSSGSVSEHFDDELVVPRSMTLHTLGVIVRDVQIFFDAHRTTSMRTSRTTNIATGLAIVLLGAHTALVIGGVNGLGHCVLSYFTYIIFKKYNTVLSIFN
jgi:hypothetical protein